MVDKGLDFKHKEVINIKDGKRLRLCSRCLCRFRNRKNNIYNSALIENKYTKFDFDRKIVRKDYITANNQNRTGYIIKEKIKYDVICKVEL